jgi:hypothetical protein
MSSARSDLNTVQAALRKTTEALAIELAHPGTVEPYWMEFEWRIARAVAVIHGVSPLLSRRLRWQGPRGWREFLDEQHNHARIRYLRMRELLELIDAEARDAGIPLVPLKGAALHSLGIYGAGDRPMADLDLLTEEHDATAAGGLLEKLGFRQKFAIARHRVFEPVRSEATASFGENSANPIKIELHSRIGESLPLRTVDISHRIFPRSPHAGLNTYPSKAALMTHLVLHAAGSMAFRAVRLVHLHDIAKLSERMTDADWDELLSHDKVVESPAWWAFPPLALTARYYACIPENVLAAAAERCQWVLRAASRRRGLSDVSLSRMWIPALPGIEWSRSLQEALTYTARRILPDATQRSLRPVLAVAQPEAQQTNPVISDSSWTDLSQGRRMLRWLLSRPPRPETLGPVRGALAQCR